MNKNQALELLHNNVQSINLRRHCYAVSFALGAIYDYLHDSNKLDANSPSREIWEIFGLIHDSDYEVTKDDLDRHTIVLLEWMKKMGITDSDVLYSAISSHNAKRTGLNAPATQMEMALECGDELTGFIVACALILPSKKLADVTAESVKKRFKEKAFARAVDRGQIEECEGMLDIKIEDFIRIVLEAMQKNHVELGL